MVPYWLLAVSGLTLILTRGEIFAHARDSFPQGFWREGAKCPMCVGFWVGVMASIFWCSPSAGISAAHRTIQVLADGTASSMASATFVFVWAALREIGPAISTWAYEHHPSNIKQQSTPKSGDPKCPS